MYSQIRQCKTLNAVLYLPTAVVSVSIDDAAEFSFILRSDS